MKDTKERLLDASQKLFTLHGFKKVSVDEIVQKAGLAKGTFYIYFPSKEDLYRELMEKNMNTMIAPAMIKYLKGETDLQMLLYKKTILGVHMIKKNKLLKELMRENPNYISRQVKCEKMQEINKEMSVDMFKKVKELIRNDIEFENIIEISMGIFNLMISMENKTTDYWQTIHSLNKVFIDGLLKKPKPWDEEKCWAIINEIKER